MRSQWIHSWQPGAGRNLLLPHAWTGSDLPPCSPRVDRCAQAILRPHLESVWRGHVEPVQSRILPCAVPEQEHPTPKLSQKTARRRPRLWPLVLCMVGLWVYLCWTTRVPSSPQESSGAKWVESVKRSAELATEESRSAWKELRR